MVGKRWAPGRPPGRGSKMGDTPPPEGALCVRGGWVGAEGGGGAEPCAPAERGGLAPTLKAQGWGIFFNFFFFFGQYRTSKK